MTSLSVLWGAEAEKIVAILGVIALAGMIMRNTIILVDQIERDIAAGHGRHQAIVDATVRRARPVALHRAGLRMMAEARRLRIRRLVALAEPGIAAAERWLRRFGFEPEEIAGETVWGCNEVL